MMNYSMQGMTKMIPELFMMMKSMKVEIRKDHYFQEEGKGKERELHVEWQASCHFREEAQS